MKNLFREIVLYLFHICFFTHLIAYCCCKQKVQIGEDVLRMSSKFNLPHKGIKGLLYHLYRNKYYRNVFYMRVGKYSKICSWILPPAPQFFVSCRSIGGGVYPAHPFCTILNAKSIGKNFSFRQCTTLGNKRDGEFTNGPVIGDNVNIGANVCIIGDIKIGNNVIVGAGSVVLKDIPDNCVVAGNPAKVIKDNKRLC